MSIAWDALTQRERDRLLEYAAVPSAVLAIVLVEEWETSLGDRELDEAEASCHDAQARHLRAVHGGSSAEQIASLVAVTDAAVAFAHAVATRFEGDLRREGIGLDPDDYERFVAVNGAVRCLYCGHRAIDHGFGDRPCPTTCGECRCQQFR